MRANKTHGILLLFILLILKLLFSMATVNEIQFFIYPVSKTIEVVTNTKAIYIIDKGFYNEELNFIINKSCSGINFFLIFFVSISYRYLLEKNNLSIYKKLFLTTLISLVATYIANTSRILSSIITPTLISFNSKLIHQIEGTFVYLFFLLLFYIIFDYSLKTKTAK